MKLPELVLGIESVAIPLATGAEPRSAWSPLILWKVTVPVGLAVGGGSLLGFWLKSTAWSRPWVPPVTVQSQLPWPSQPAGGPTLTGWRKRKIRFLLVAITSGDDALLAYV